MTQWPSAASVVQAALLILLSPLLTGIIKKVKCLFQCRRGPSVLQGYYDLAKLIRKTPTISENASWIYRANPYVTLAAVISAAALVPTAGGSDSSGSFGDAILFIYYLALGRVSSTLAAIDTAGSFGGMGASRELMVSSLAEPVLMGVLFLAGGSAGTLDMGAMTPGHNAVAAILGFMALAVLTVAETGRIPVDNPDTHLELTMIHEGMLLEYSGRHLAMLTWAAHLKQLIVVSLVVNLFVPGIPHGGPVLNLCAYLVKVLAIGVSLALCECTYAKMRLFRVPSLLRTAWILATIGAVVAVCGVCIVN